MTRKKKCNSKSNSFVAVAEQVCLQPVLEHRQQRGRHNIAWHFYGCTLYACIQDCGLVLFSDVDGHGCYPLDDHILCKTCNARRIQLLTGKATTDLWCPYCGRYLTVFTGGGKCQHHVWLDEEAASWRHGIVVSAIWCINKVTQRRTQLVLG